MTDLSQKVILSPDLPEAKGHTPARSPISRGRANRRRVAAERLSELEIAKDRTKQLTAAAGLLEEESATTRLAGMQALVRLADEDAALRQLCIDLLCAAVRTAPVPYPGQAGENEAKNADQDKANDTDQDNDTNQDRANDKAKDTDQDKARAAKELVAWHGDQPVQAGGSRRHHRAPARRCHRFLAWPQPGLHRSRFRPPGARAGIPRRDHRHQRQLHRRQVHWREGQLP